MSTSVQSSSTWDGLRDSKRRENPVKWIAADGKSLSTLKEDWMSSAE